METPAPAALIECEVPVFFATSEGQTRRIAQRMAEHLRAWGIDSYAIDVGSAAADAVNWARVRAVAVGASVHREQHQEVAADFIRTYKAQLNAHPSVFFSVSLGAVSPEPEYVQLARQLANEFPPSLGWHPSSIVCFGGALAYREYGALKRLMMRAIAKSGGWPTDTRRNHEFTDWNEVELLAHKILRLLQERAPLVA
jgi:menaquinone-dependent protoporphyrinogen oxidase